MRIFLTMLQMLAILNKMETTSTKRSGEAFIQTFFDYTLYFLLPENWVMDFDCLLVDLEPQDKYFMRLMGTIFLPPLLLVINVLMIFVLTFCVKLCHFSQREHMKPLNCNRLGNRVLMAMSMQLFFIYPTILYTLFSTMNCFESLSETETHLDL